MSGSVSAVITAVEGNGQFLISTEKGFISLGAFIHQLFEDGGSFHPIGMAFNPRPTVNAMYCTMFVIVPVDTITAGILIPELKNQKKEEEKEND